MGPTAEAISYFERYNYFFFGHQREKKAKINLKTSCLLCTHRPGRRGRLETGSSGYSQDSNVQ